jgi:CCR4-NOT transcription complex subunit 6
MTSSARKDFAKHGCAIFYKKDQFEVFASTVVHFSELLAMPYAEHPDNKHEDPALRKSSVYEEMNRPNVAMIVGLKVKEKAGDAAAATADPLGFYVTNTHLFWDPRYRFVRLKQCQTLLDHLALLQTEYQTRYPSVLCGDWNVTPDNIIFHYLTERNELERNEEEWRKFLTPAEHGCQHTFTLRQNRDIGCR